LDLADGGVGGGGGRELEIPARNSSNLYLETRINQVVVCCSTRRIHQRLISIARNAGTKPTQNPTLSPGYRTMCLLCRTRRSAPFQSNAKGVFDIGHFRWLEPSSATDACLIC
jgi:hypothetical protein